MCVGAHVEAGATLGSLSSPSTMWASGLELRLPCLAPGNFSCWTHLCFAFQISKLFLSDCLFVFVCVHNSVTSLNTHTFPVLEYMREQIRIEVTLCADVGLSSRGSSGSLCLALRFLEEAVSLGTSGSIASTKKEMNDEGSVAEPKPCQEDPSWKHSGSVLSQGIVLDSSPMQNLRKALKSLELASGFWGDLHLYPRFSPTGGEEVGLFEAFLGAMSCQAVKDMKRTPLIHLKSPFLWALLGKRNILQWLITSVSFKWKLTTKMRQQSIKEAKWIPKRFDFFKNHILRLAYRDMDSIMVFVVLGIEPCTC